MNEGRKDYIIMRALTYAIATIEHLPVEQQALSRQADMMDLLEHYAPGRVRQELFVIGGLLDGITDVEGALQ